MTDVIYLRDIDGTGSMHVCLAGDDGAVAYVPEDLPVEAAKYAGPGEAPHVYSPDIMAQGDCRICGHTAQAHEAAMSDAPETIWLTNFIKDDCGAKLGRGTISDLDHGTEYPEYRRADLPPNTAQIMADPRALVDVLIGTATSLAAAISLLERGGKKAAPSDKMFDQMLTDYKGNLDDARAALDQLKEPSK